MGSSRWPRVKVTTKSFIDSEDFTVRFVERRVSGTVSLALPGVDSTGKSTDRLFSAQKVLTLRYAAIQVSLFLR
jgi:hypothetical protein